jgi:hypothetical protein
MPVSAISSYTSQVSMVSRTDVALRRRVSVSAKKRQCVTTSTGRALRKRSL